VWWREDILVATADSRFLDDVRALLESTQRDEATLAEFEPRFLHLHAERRPRPTSTSTGMPLSTPESSAEAIEDLFWMVEEFVAEPTLRTAPDPDEHALLEAIDTCLTRLGS
jgi:hypothetical protein